MSEDEVGFSEAELAEMREELARARRSRARGRLLGRIGIVGMLVCLPVIFFGWQFLPGPAVVPGTAIALVAGVVFAGLMKVFVGSWRVDDHVVAAREHLLAAAEALSDDSE